MFGINFNKNKNEQQNDGAEDKHELEQFFEDEDWDIGHKGGEVDKEQEIDWSNYDFMHGFDDLPQSDRGHNEDLER